jgi:hypothetical protein
MKMKALLLVILVFLLNSFCIVDCFDSKCKISDNQKNTFKKAKNLLKQSLMGSIHQQLIFLDTIPKYTTHDKRVITIAHQILQGHQEQLIEFQKYIRGDTNNLDPLEIKRFNKKYGIRDQDYLRINRNKIRNEIMEAIIKLQIADTYFKAIIKKRS